MSGPPPANTAPGNNPLNNVSPNYSSVTPPRPEDLVRPPAGNSTRSRKPAFFVLGRAKIVGIVETWIEASVAITGVSGHAYEGADSWERAVYVYTRAYRTNALTIVRVPTLPAPPAPPGLSASQALLVDSNAPTPIRPIHVRSSPAPAQSSPQPETPTRAPLGSRYHPMMIGSSPTPPSTQQSTHKRRHHTVDTAPTPTPTPSRRSEKAPTSNHDKAVSTYRPGSHSGKSPAPVTPRRPNTAAASAARLRSIEEALDLYADRNNISMPSPVTPTSTDISYDGLQARLSAVEEMVNILLTREAQRASAFDEWRTRLISRLQTSASGPPADQQDGRDPQESQLDGRDLTPRTPIRSPSTRPRAAGNSTAPVAGSSTGPGTAAAANSAAPVAGSSTGPGTVAHGSRASQDIDLFSGYEDYSPEQVAQLEALLNAKGY